MALNLKIDFDNKYETDSISEDLRESSFTSLLSGNTSVALQVSISNQAHELLPNVYNLAFGPLKANGRIDDKAELTHQDYSKTFSTILLNGLTYLTANPDHYLGVDGSDNARAYLYYRTLQHNYDYLAQFFHFFGVKYYVRISRFGKTQYANPFDFEDIVFDPVRIEKNMVLPRQMMFNYFIFSLKK